MFTQLLKVYYIIVYLLIPDQWDLPENEVFRRIASEKGIPEQKIILEQRATNMGQSIVLSHDICRMNGINPTKIILVHMPFMEKRLYASFMKQWPDYFMMKEIKLVVKSPPIDLIDYPTPAVGNINDVISMTLGTLQRIREYPVKKFQIHMKIPNDVWSAYKELVATGRFYHHLLDLETDNKSGSGA